MRSVEALCSRVMVLENGGVVYEGDTKTGVNHYLSLSQFEQDSSLNQNLNDRTDRNGSGKVKFVGAKTLIELANGNYSTNLISGRKFIMQITIEKEIKESLKSIVFSVGFFNSEGSLLFACRSDAVGKYYCISDRITTVSLELPKLPLASGSYVYSLICYEKSEVVDFIKKAGLITVQEGDFYGTGFVPAPNFQGVYLDYEYKND